MTATADKLRYHVDEAGCWLWDGYVAANGYARIYDRDHRKIVWAHRYSYEVANGPIPAGYEIDHECQVTRCINPDHLGMVTRAEHVRRTISRRVEMNDRHVRAVELRRLNLTYAEVAQALGYSGRESAKAAVTSAIAKGLVAADALPPVKRLSEEDCADIRELYEFGIPQTVIGDAYGVDGSHISRVLSGNRWKSRAAS